METVYHAGSLLLLVGVFLIPASAFGKVHDEFTDGPLRASIVTNRLNGELRSYELTTNAELRDNKPADQRIAFSELADHPRTRTGNLMFDGLYALAITEALQNSVSQIRDGAYGHGEPIQLEAFQTGEFWTYVWTRDLSYSTHLALAGFDPLRAARSLLFKTSTLKPSVTGGFANQIVQDTGSGGSYPVSSDRIVWILGASETLKYLDGAERTRFLQKVYPILRDTLEQDRRLVFDAGDGLYRGEQSFLDWREQTYPGWTRDNVVAIAMSKALSVNVANYFALLTASEYAGRLGLRDDRARYAAWAKQLRSAIHRHFYDPEAGLYSTYLLADTAFAVRARRYDLLGESLAVLLGVADDAQSKSILSHYPTGPYGPPVVWPQERTVPIYHNHAIWPFVTAYWIKAARKAGNAAVVDHGIRSLMRGAAFNLSNMENFDLATGKPEVKNGVLSGPVVNSRRQLWSVAGYLAMVQDVVFGLETSWDGIRFLPFVTGRLREETFGSTDVLELRNFKYRGRTIDVRVHLPPTGNDRRGACRVGRIELNGKRIGNHFVAAGSLQDRNQWDVYLEADGGDEGRLEWIADRRAVFGPVQPEWENIGRGGITVENGRLTLHYRHADASNVVFNIYRNGRLCARRVAETRWLDPDSADYASRTYFYAVEAMDAKSGNVSHLTPTRFYATTNSQWTIPATEMENRGGKLAEGRYFMDWGRPDHELRVKNFTARRSGRHLVRAEFANGSGPVNTGITCAVKRLEIREADSGKIVGTGYLVLPQSGNWRRFDLSTPVWVELKAGRSYSIRIFEDEYSRNMSYLEHNRRYTAHTGGGDSAYNFVNIASLHLLYVSE